MPSSIESQQQDNQPLDSIKNKVDENDKPIAESQQIQVKFITNDSKYAVTDTPMMIPTSLRKFGLSEIINHLLDLPKAIAFEFMIDGSLLRSSLISYITEKNISLENILTIEYFRSTKPPKMAMSLPHDDWVSSVSARFPFSSKNMILSGCFDGHARIFDLSGNVIASTSNFVNSSIKLKMPIKSVAWGLPTQQNSSLNVPFYTASQDHNVLGWSVNVDNADSSSIIPILEDQYLGHTSSVESIVASTKYKMLVSGSFDGDIVLHSINPDDYENDEDDEDGKSSKKRKTNKGSDNVTTKKVEQKPQMAKITKAHSGCVSSLLFDNMSTENQIELISGGWDKAIMHWDLMTQTSKTTMTCDSVVLSCDQQSNSASQNNLIASGHTDHFIRLWDPRIDNGIAVKMKLGSHKGWVSGVSWQKSKIGQASSSPYSLASCSYDSKIRIWDIRSQAPIYTISFAQSKDDTNNTTDSKIFDIDWVGKELFVGGEDGKLRIFTTD